MLNMIDKIILISSDLQNIKIKTRSDSLSAQFQIQQVPISFQRSPNITSLHACMLSETIFFYQASLIKSKDFLFSFCFALDRSY